jgi:hypothetical protein
VDKTDPIPSHDDVLPLPTGGMAKANASGGMNSVAQRG